MDSHRFQRDSIAVIVERSENGRYQWISDEDGNCWGELDFELDLAIVPIHLQEIVGAAYEWAKAQNETIQHDATDEDMGHVNEEIEEWRTDYYRTRGVT